ncbi:MAG: CotH kinase family protein, partial [Flavobacteriales bacterium]
MMMAILAQGCYKVDAVYDADPDENYELPLILRLNGKDCAFDAETNTLRYSLTEADAASFEPFVEFQSYSEITFNNQVLVNREVNLFGEIEPYELYNLVIESLNTTQTFKLIFTEFPVMQIITPNRFGDEPKTLARTRIHYPEFSEPTFTSYIGIERRGNTSQFFPKKPLGFSCVASKYIEDAYSASLFGFDAVENWMLDPMYYDKSRQRAASSLEIWRSMAGETHFASPNQTVEVFLNNEYRGLFNLRQNMTPEFLGLTSPDALLFKGKEWGLNQFYEYDNSPPSVSYWGGWEQDFPLPEIRLNWEPLRNLSWIVVKANSQEFETQIASAIDIENVIDYYLFINLVYAPDNLGKNLFLTRENANEPFKLIPWDLDGTWGLFWDGSPLGHEGILSNGLFSRLLNENPNNYKQQLKTRWTAL